MPGAIFSSTLRFSTIASGGTRPWAISARPSSRSLPWRHELTMVSAIPGEDHWTAAAAIGRTAVAEHPGYPALYFQAVFSILGAGDTVGAWDLLQRFHHLGKDPPPPVAWLVALIPVLSDPKTDPKKAWAPYPG